MEQESIIDAQLVPDPVVDRRQVRWRELLAIVAMVVLADVTIYRGHGYAGWASVLMAVPLLMLWGAPPRVEGQQPRRVGSLLVVGTLVVLLAAKMIWCGHWFHPALGLTLLFAFALGLSGTIPYVVEILVFPARLMLGGLLGLAAYMRVVRRPAWGMTRFAWLSFLLPLAAFMAFSLLFILANPDLLDSFGQRMEQVLKGFREWLIDFSPHPLEMLFWAAMAWISIGMLRPLLSRPLFEDLDLDRRGTKAVEAAYAESPFYAAARNTLVTVLVLFGIYLVFEFKTLWFRKFPPGFYYSGYAHQGAAWLTVALALATFVLSLIFRGTILRDPRLGALRRCAWLWSFENILLATAVYHRLFIYVGFNGMTRMRVVGILGISSVLVGFLLVVWNIARNRGFLWLMRRHLWTVALAVYLYGVLPVDMIVVDYNVRRVMAGDSAPSVQITEQEISAEGVAQLIPLLACDDLTVREGVRAYLAREQARFNERSARHWTAFQLADRRLQSRLHAVSEELAIYSNRQLRQQALDDFRAYAYQWY